MERILVNRKEAAKQLCNRQQNDSVSRRRRITAGTQGKRRLRLKLSVTYDSRTERQDACGTWMKILMLLFRFLWVVCWVRDIGGDQGWF